jgi:predicted DNA-binding antitoxin AbrB/MazE fold protein
MKVTVAAIDLPKTCPEDTQMTQVIQAIYEDRVLKPLEHLALKEHQQVQVTVQPVSSDESDNLAPTSSDPLAGVRVATGIRDLAANFDDYRFGLGNK